MAIAHVNTVMGQYLDQLGRSPCILAGNQQFHKDMAMREAHKVSSAGEAAARHRAQAQCVAHLIASLEVQISAGDSDDPS